MQEFFFLLSTSRLEADVFFPFSFTITVSTPIPMLLLRYVLSIALSFSSPVVLSTCLKRPIPSINFCPRLLLTPPKSQRKPPVECCSFLFVLFFYGKFITHPAALLQRMARSYVSRSLPPHHRFTMPDAVTVSVSPGKRESAT